MAFVFPSAEHPATVQLSKDERNKMLDLITSRDTDEAVFHVEEDIARVGKRVLVDELDGEFYCEEYQSEEAAANRFAELDKNLAWPPPTSEVGVS